MCRKKLYYSQGFFFFLSRLASRLGLLEGLMSDKPDLLQACSCERERESVRVDGQN